MIDQKELTYRVVAGAVGAMIIGAGSMIIKSDRELAEHGVHISTIEERQLHMESVLANVDKGVATVNDKVDVVNQKLDDTKAAVNAKKDAKK